VKGASEGEGLGNKFLSHIREVDAILQVVRCFEDPDVIHVAGAVNPVSDMETIEIELMLADIQHLDNLLPKAERAAKSADKEAKLKVEAMKKCLAHLSEQKPLRTLALDEAEQKAVKEFGLLTAKPILYVANVDESDLAGKGPLVQAVRAAAAKAGAEVVPVCAKLEAEIAELDPADRAEMLSGAGLTEPSLAALARAAYKTLGLQSYFTAGEKEVRAWTIPVGALAPQAAGVIHTDFEKGFIRAEIYSLEDLEQYHTEKDIRAHGKLRVEGKDYAMRDGDICHFLVNK
jgi:GTP-binding protein YchF